MPPTATPIAAIVPRSIFVGLAGSSAGFAAAAGAAAAAAAAAAGGSGVSA